MIKKEAYSIDWLEAKVKEYDAASYDLAEKMMYAFTLLEQLKFNGLNFTFKGGTSLVLMIDGFHRFSKDIDIIMPKEPENLNEIFDAVIKNSAFIRWEESERKNDEFQVPKKHFKFYYNESKPSKFPEKPILLDIIFVPCTYPETRIVKVQHPFLPTEEPYAEITIPTFDSITGDKLTAFAPNTIGIPIGKGKAVEIAKQLFDLHLLYDKVDSHEKVAECFHATAQMCVDCYQRNFTIDQVYDDVIETAFVMAMMGKHNPAVFGEIKDGVNSLSQYLSKQTRFGYNVALTAAARIAYLTACLMKGIKPQKLDWQKMAQQEEFKTKRIEHEKYGVLNKQLKAGYPEAWYYWLNTVEVLAQEKKAGNGTPVKKATAVAAVEEVKESKPVKQERKNDLQQLVFIVNGKETLVDKVNPNEPLRAPVERALAQTGNSARGIDQWLVKWNNIDLDINRKVGDYKFPADVKIFLSLKSGVGG